MCVCVFVCCSLQPLANDISIVARVFSLPVLEPMTPARLHKITTVAMTCLFTAMSVSMAVNIVSTATGPGQKVAVTTGPKDEEVDGYAATVVQKSVCYIIVELYTCYQRIL